MEGSSVNLYALPPEEETLELVKHYFKDTGFLFPFIHEESFIQTFVQMRRDVLNKVRKSWLGLLNLILAFATTTKMGDLAAEERFIKSDVFYQRAVGLCQSRTMRGSSIEIGKPRSAPCIELFHS